MFIPVINLAVNTLNLDHREAHCSVTKFLSEFVTLSNNALSKGLSIPNQAVINKVLNEITPKAIEYSIHSIVYLTMKDAKDDIADLLFEMIATNRKVSYL